MVDRILTHESRDGGDLAHYTRGADGAPTTAIIKLCEHPFRRVARGEDPQRNDDSKESKYVQDKDKAFQQREMTGEVDVDDSSNKHNTDREQSFVPSFSRIVGVVQRDKAPNQSPSHVCRDGSASLPPQSGEPA